MRRPNDPKLPAPDFGKVSVGHAEIFIAIMNTLHGEPTAPAFGRLLQKKLEPDDYMLLAHLFEEISVMALHHLIPEALLFDAFAFDLYWDELREDVLGVRRLAGNAKFCENFEIAAERAQRYRKDFPPKLRWQRRDRPGDPPPERGGGGGGGGGRGPAPAPRPAPEGDVVRPR